MDFYYRPLWLVVNPTSLTPIPMYQDPDNLLLLVDTVLSFVFDLNILQKFLLYLCLNKLSLSVSLSQSFLMKFPVWG